MQRSRMGVRTMRFLPVVLMVCWPRRCWRAASPCDPGHSGTRTDAALSSPPHAHRPSCCSNPARPGPAMHRPRRLQLQTSRAHCRLPPSPTASAQACSPAASTPVAVRLACPPCGARGARRAWLRCPKATPALGQRSRWCHALACSQPAARSRRSRCRRTTLWWTQCCTAAGG